MEDHPQNLIRPMVGLSLDGSLIQQLEAGRLLIPFGSFSGAPNRLLSFPSPRLVAKVKSGLLTVPEIAMPIRQN
jgi:hypothetical protein